MKPEAQQLDQTESCWDWFVQLDKIQDERDAEEKYWYEQKQLQERTDDQ